MTSGGKSFLLYGATGYTGSLVAASAHSSGLRPLLAGRDRRKLEPLARSLGLDFRVIELEDGPRLEKALREVTTVLHAAGPFSKTWYPMAVACLRTGTHYLDITGEIEVIEALQRLDARARTRGIMLLPAVGFDAAPFDCLAAELQEHLPTARRLRFAMDFIPWPWLSRGSAGTLLEGSRSPVQVWSGEKSVPVPKPVAKWMVLAGRRRRVAQVTAAATACAFHSTGIGEIETLCTMNRLQLALHHGGLLWGHRLAARPWRPAFAACLRGIPAGPSSLHRSVARCRVVAEVEDEQGRRAKAEIETGEAYATTVATALEAVRCVLAGEFKVGFQTPARAFGTGFFRSIKGIVRGGA